MLQKILPQKKRNLIELHLPNLLLFSKIKVSRKIHIKCRKQNMIISWKMNTKKILSRNFK